MLYISPTEQEKNQTLQRTEHNIQESNELRLFEFVSGLMMLVVSAIRSIGEGNLTEDIVNRIKRNSKKSLSRYLRP